MNVGQVARQIRKESVIACLAIVSVAIGVYDLSHPRVSARLTPLDMIDLAIVFIFIWEFLTRGEQPRNLRQRSGEFFGEPDQKSFGPPDVAEPIHVFILDHFADELRTAL
jgi:hypothetical protein